jgi:DNA-binding MarR family transcriptional regulator
LEKAVRQFRTASKIEFKKAGVNLSGEQWVVMKRLYENPGSSQKSLAETTYKDPASVTRMLDSLKKKGYIKRLSPEADKRKLEIYLTQEGTNLVERLLPLAVDIRKRGLEGLEEKEVEVLKKALRTISKNFS